MRGLALASGGAESAVVSEGAAADAGKVAVPKLLARFRVNHTDTLSVFTASLDEDFLDVAGLLPPDTSLPATDKMTYLLARLEVGAGGGGVSVHLPPQHLLNQ